MGKWRSKIQVNGRAAKGALGSRRSKIVAVLALPILLLVLAGMRWLPGLWGDRPDLDDELLIADFRKNKGDLEHVVERFNAGDSVQWLADVPPRQPGFRDAGTAKEANASPSFRALYKRLRLCSVAVAGRDVHFIRCPEGSDDRCRGGCYVGFVYAEQASEPVVADLDDHHRGRAGAWYRRIGDHWYAFLSHDD